MKKLLLFAMSMATLSLVAMEQNQQEPFPYEQLLPELKGLVLQAIADAANVPEAITNFKNLLLTSKQFNTQQVNDLFLNALLKKFPGQEVRIAKLLNNQFAKEWLNARRKAKGLIAYNPIKTTHHDMGLILEAVLSGDLVKVREWLEKGYDPSTILRSAIDLGPPGRSLPLIKLLVSYGANVNKETESVKNKFISILYSTLREKNNQSNAEGPYGQHYSEIADYLIQEGATLKPSEEEELIKLREKK